MIRLLCLVLIPALVCSMHHADPDPNDPIFSATVKANWKVGLETYKEIVKESPQKSIFFSPFGLTTALFNLYLGASGATRDAIKTELGIPDLEQKHVEVQAKIAKGVMEDKGKSYDLNFVRRFYFDKSISILPKYSKEVQQLFALGTGNVDFKDTTGTTKEINEFIAKGTNDKFKDFLPATLITPDTKFLIASAVDFTPKWSHKFDSSAKAAFTGLSGQTTQVDFMEESGIFKIGLFKDKGLTALEIPLLNTHYALYILLPDAADKLTASEAGLLQSGALKKLLTEMKYYNAKVKLPKFLTKSHYELSSEFKNSGLTAPFDPATADFSHIDSDTKFALKFFVQEAQIHVLEDGGDGGDGAGETHTPVNVGETYDFTANRPFLYSVICTKSLVPFFIGRYTGN